MKVSDLVLKEDWLRVLLDDAPIRHADFHYLWLRHNSELDRHPVTRERVVCSSELPRDVRPLDARIVDGSLALTWPDAEGPSVHTAGWLVEHAYAADRDAAPPPPSDLDAILVSTGDRLANDVIDRVRARGAAVVRGAGDDTEALIDAFAAAGLTVIPTHFGRIEDLRTDNTTNQNTDQLGYTDARVDLHTDQPFIESPPPYQLLHCMRAAPEGGENFLVDALAASRYLRDIDLDAWQRLTTMPVRFHRKQEKFEALQVRPILSGDGESFQVRSSYFTLDPYRLPFGEMMAWYRAHDRFAAIVRDPRHQYRFRLEAGDFVFYDNYRMLHARTGFRGARWLRGVYFDS